jgi:HSP20 family molecular chaperone IbpA
MGMTRFGAWTATLSNKIDQQQISAQVEEGMLTFTLQKTPETALRRIEIA